MVPQETFIGIGLLLGLWFTREVIGYVLKFREALQSKRSASEAPKALYRDAPEVRATDSGSFRAVGITEEIASHRELVALEKSLLQQIEQLHIAIATLSNKVSDLTRAVGQLEGKQGVRPVR